MPGRRLAHSRCNAWMRLLTREEVAMRHRRIIHGNFQHGSEWVYVRAPIHAADGAEQASAHSSWSCDAGAQKRPEPRVAVRVAPTRLPNGVISAPSGP